MHSNLQIFNSELEKFLENTKNLWERIDKINRAIQDPRSPPPFDDHACQKCGSIRFSYDSFSRELSCENCGWAVSFKMAGPESPQSGEFDFIVWETSTLAKAALMPMVHLFSGYGAIIDSNLETYWDSLMTVAMTGAAVQAEDTLSYSQVQAEIKRALSNLLNINAELFDDYYEYTKARTRRTKATWCGVSALWVADKLRLSGKATAALKRNTQQLDFVNKLSTFMSVSFGSTEEGFSYYLAYMALDVEKNMGIDMGFGTNGTKRDPEKKVSIIAHIFESFVQNTVELIAMGSGQQMEAR